MARTYVMAVERIRSQSGRRMLIMMLLWYSPSQ
jgi:hypothetical protein